MITNKLGLPQPFVDAATSDHRYKPGRYSVTELLGGTCAAVLKRRHADDMEVDAADNVWAIFGSAAHEILRRSKETETQLKEDWLCVDMGDGYELSGVFDLYDDSTGTVTDYKTTSVWKIQFADYEDWRKQTLVYCWMLRSIGFDARRGEIVALLKDHSKRKAMYDKDYPQHPVCRVGWDFGPSDFDKISKYIKEWFDDVWRQEATPDEWLA